MIQAAAHEWAAAVFFVHHAADHGISCNLHLFPQRICSDYIDAGAEKVYNECKTYKQGVRISMDAEERESGITFGEICHLIGKKIWMVLGIAAGVAVLAVILFALVLNPLGTSYSMSFELIYPTSTQQQYPDGTPFSYRNIISRTILEAAKRKDERLVNTDVVTMIEQDHVQIAAKTEEDGSVVYTLTVHGKYFANEEMAQLFIRSVANATVDDIMSRASKLAYGISEESFNGNNFEARLDLLNELYTTLLSVYGRWISTYSSGYQVTVDGTARSLSDYRAGLYGIYGKEVRNVLAEECENSGYSLLYGDEEELAGMIPARVDQLKKEYALNEQIIAALREQLDSSTDGGGASAAYSLRAVTLADKTEEGGNNIVIEQPDPTLEQRIAYYTERNAVIASQLGDAVTGGELNGTLTVEKAQEFAQKIDGYFTSLNAEAEVLKNVTTAIYRQNTFADFISQTAESDGDTNIVLVGVAAFILVFLIASVIVCAVEYNRGRRIMGQADGACSVETQGSADNAQDGEQDDVQDGEQDVSDGQENPSPDQVKPE